MPGILSSYGSDYAAGTGAPSPIVDALSQLPSGYSMMGWNTLRGSRTILKGGFDQGIIGRRTSPIGRWMFGSQEKKTIRNSIRGSNPLGPRSWTKMANQNMLHGNELTPLDILPKIGNTIGGWMLGGSNARASGMAEKLASKGITSSKETPLFSHGFLARSMAANKMTKGMSGRRYSSVTKFLGGDEALGKSMQAHNMFSTMAGKEAGFYGSEYSHFTQAAMKGTASQYLGGYMRGAVAGMPSREAYGVLEGAGKNAYLKGATSVTEKFGRAGLQVEGGVLKATGREAAEKFGVKEGEKVAMRTALRVGGTEVAGAVGARALGLAIPGVNIALTAMMVYDFTKMGMSLMKGGVQTLAEAGKSFKGSVEKGVMGMGYRDTTVAATSRQRGVMAIQASRLNARSVLGSEASYMSAHFG